MRKTINHICGGCGATGRVFIGLRKEERPCLDCDGTGYQAVEMSLDHHEADRLRSEAKQASLGKFILLLSALIGGGVTYYYARGLSNELMAAYFFGSAIVSFVILKLPFLRGLLQVLYNLLRIGIGFLLLLGLIGGIVYLMYLARKHGGW